MVTVTVETGFSGIEPQDRAVASRHNDDHGLADGPTDREQKAPTTPGSAGSSSTRRIVSDWVAPGRATHPQRQRHLRRMSSDKEEIKGISMIPITILGGKGAGGADIDPDGRAQSRKKRSDGHQGEEAVDDGRNARENLDHRLDHRPHLVGGILRQVDRSH